MANNDLSVPGGFTDNRRGRGTTGSTVFSEVANISSISAMRARLAALVPSAYTPAALDAMTENDMLYALRTHSSDVAGIK